LQAELHCQFLAHYVLISFMTVATFIDYDEQLIPDTITLPGTLLGLLGSALAMLWFPLLPVTTTLIEMDAASLGAWPTSLDGTQGLVLGLLIVALWCFALLDRRWITRRGWRKAPRYFIARLFRTRWWLIVGGLWLVVSVGVLLAWQVQCSRWQYLLSSLIGLAFAGGLTWGVRVAARLALQVEALGFGDVTLMAMIGTYIGWQPSLLVFFLAPLFAVCVFVLRALITGNGAGPYGPYLCMATVAVLVYWDSLRMTYAAPILTLPPMVTITILVLAVVMMGTMLWIWRLIKGPVRGLG
jgi:prepilin signal peptidase PulO-like enzyme (type II secretory pathway)